MLQMAVVTADNIGSKEAAKAGFLYRPEVRAIIYQVILLAAVIAFFTYIISNTIFNLRRLGIASGFDFMSRTAGFDISQTLIPYSAGSTYLTAFLVGLWNTVLVSALGIVFATILGFVVGIARLSNNWLIARLGTVFVEVLRNIPLLLLLLFMYFAVLKSDLLPQVRQAYGPWLGSYLSNRGLNLPAPILEPGFGYVVMASLAALACAIGIGMWARRRRLLTGQQFPAFWAGLAVLVAVPLIAAVVTGRPMSFDYPVKGTFNFSGGFVVSPEFLALLFGLSIYTASFIAEAVRAGILAVSKGQKEAAAALGLSPNQALRLVVLPQAARIMIPPMTSNFLSLTKNSSLALAIAYPDLVAVTGTMLNQTGQAVEIILLTMAVYLTLSLLTSLLMNWFNARIALVER
jgi:general L-amino acid transport system permease protein